MYHAFSALSKRHIAVIGAVVAGLLFAATPPTHAADVAFTGYLNGADIGYLVPPAPDNNSKTGIRDLRAVIAAQLQPSAMRTEAYEDAAAYDYDELLPHFSVAAGTSLNLHTRPILAHMLNMVLQDVGGYVGLAKNAKERARPYLEDRKIIPCETDYLRSSDLRSYPSGHSANGYSAALLLSAVMPERTPLLMARGVRYGENRIICGVHHPTDVLQGQKIAAAYFKRVVSNDRYQVDLVCAVEEHRSSIAVRTVSLPPPYSAKCAALAASYIAEAKDRADAASKQRHSFDQM